MKDLLDDIVADLVGRSRKVLSPRYQEVLVKRTVPVIIKGLTNYFRLKIEGMQHIPDQGPAIIVANHSGIMAFDAVMLAWEIAQTKKRIPHIVAHRLWFAQSRVKHLAESMGMVEPSKEKAGELLEDGHMIILFPEGEAGNFKPSSKAYHLREFKRGFVRLAVNHKVPVIPVAIIGGEEANVNLKEITILKEAFGVTIPVPLNVVPLPSRWHMRIMPPTKWSVDPEFKMGLDDPRLRVLAHRVRQNIFHEIRQMLELRGSPWL